MQRVWDRPVGLLLIGTVLAMTYYPTRRAAGSGAPPVHLTLWHQAGNVTLAQLGIPQIFDQWAAANAPGATLTIVEKYNDDLLNNMVTQDPTPPDLIWAVDDDLPGFVNRGFLQPVDNLADMGLFMPALVANVQIDRKTYGLPVDAGNFLLLYYNKLYIKTPPKTFAELISISHHLQQQYPNLSSFAPLVYQQNDPLWVVPVAHAFGATEFGADGITPTLDSSGWVRAFQLLHDLKFVEKIEPVDCDYECADQRFRTGNAAIIFNGDWAIQGTNSYITALGADLGVAAWPSIGPTPGQHAPIPFIYGEYLMLSSALSGTPLTTAQAFARFIATDAPTILSWTVPNRHLPALLSALTQPAITHDPILAQTAQILQSGIPQPVSPTMDCLWSALTNVTIGVMNDSMTPVNAATQSQKAAQMCIAALKPPITH